MTDLSLIKDKILKLDSVFSLISEKNGQLKSAEKNCKNLLLSCREERAKNEELQKDAANYKKLYTDCMGKYLEMKNKFEGIDSKYAVLKEEYAKSRSELERIDVDFKTKSFKMFLEEIASLKLSDAILHFSISLAKNVSQNRIEDAKKNKDFEEKLRQAETAKEIHEMKETELLNDIEVLQNKIIKMENLHNNESDDFLGFSRQDMSVDEDIYHLHCLHNNLISDEDVKLIFSKMKLYPELIKDFSSRTRSFKEEDNCPKLNIDRRKSTIDVPPKICHKMFDAEAQTDNVSIFASKGIKIHDRLRLINMETQTNQITKNFGTQAHPNLLNNSTQTQLATKSKMIQTDDEVSNVRVKDKRHFHSKHCRVTLRKALALFKSSKIDITLKNGKLISYNNRSGVQTSAIMHRRMEQSILSKMIHYINTNVQSGSENDLLNKINNRYKHIRREQFFNSRSSRKMSNLIKSRMDLHQSDTDSSNSLLCTNYPKKTRIASYLDNKSCNELDSGYTSDHEHSEPLNEDSLKTDSAVETTDIEKTENVKKMEIPEAKTIPNIKRTVKKPEDSRKRLMRAMARLPKQRVLMTQNNKYTNSDKKSQIRGSNSLTSLPTTKLSLCVSKSDAIKGAEESKKELSDDQIFLMLKEMQSIPKLLENLSEDEVIEDSNSSQSHDNASNCSSDSLIKRMQTRRVIQPIMKRKLNKLSSGEKVKRPKGEVEPQENAAVINCPPDNCTLEKENLIHRFKDNTLINDALDVARQSNTDDSKNGIICTLNSSTNVILESDNKNSVADNIKLCSETNVHTLREKFKNIDSCESNTVKVGSSCGEDLKQLRRQSFESTKQLIDDNKFISKNKRTKTCSTLESSTNKSANMIGHSNCSDAEDSKSKKIELNTRVATRLHVKQTHNKILQIENKEALNTVKTRLKQNVIAASSTSSTSLNTVPVEINDVKSSEYDNADKRDAPTVRNEESVDENTTKHQKHLESTLAWHHFTRIFKRIVRFKGVEKHVEIATKVFRKLEVKRLISYMLRETINDKCEREKGQSPFEPYLSVTQKTVLGLLLRIEAMYIPNIIELFLVSCEQHLLFHEKDPITIENITRVYAAICKMKKMKDRLRRTISDGMYFMGDLVVPLIFYIVTTWVQVLRKNANDDTEEPLMQVLIQMLHTRTNRSPEYCVSVLKNLLEVYFKYPKERYNENNLMKTFLEKYICSISVNYETAILVLCKNYPDAWAYKQLTLIKELVLILKDEETVVSLVKLMGKVNLQFKDADILKKSKELLVDLDKDVPQYQLRPVLDSLT